MALCQVKRVFEEGYGFVHRNCSFLIIINTFEVNEDHIYEHFIDNVA